MLPDLKIDNSWRGIRKEVLQFLCIHREMSLNNGQSIGRRGRWQHDTSEGCF